MPSTSKLFSYNDVSIPYITIGKGPPLLFLSGFGANPQTYASIYEPFTKDFSVISPQVPPFCTATVPRTAWNFYDYGIFFDAFLTHLDVQDVLVVGHCFGGGIGLALASQSSRISKLIVMDPVGVPMEPKERLMLRHVLKKTLYFRLLGRETTKLSLWGPFFQTLFIHLLESPKISAITRSCIEDRRINIESVRVPTLVFWGQQDELIGTRYGEYLASKLPNGTLKIVPGYHNWCFYEPNLLYQEALPFLQTR